jgi:N-acetylmuramoyl-L-alanine amidase
MSFTHKDPEPLMRPEQVMIQMINIAEAMELPNVRDACIIAGMTVAQESDYWCPANKKEPTSEQYPHDSMSDDGRSVGYFQQQTGPRGELWWGTVEQEMMLQSAATSFFERLRKLPYHARDPQSANDFAQAIQRSGVPQAYAKHYDATISLYDRSVGRIDESAPTTPPEPSWRGDPVWLRDVVAAEGVKTAEVEGWLDRGHGDFGKIWGVVVHHTGGDNTPVSEISHHPALGLCSQIHLAKDGTATMCGVGVAWHAGPGSYPGLPEDGANGVTIGIENVNLPPQGGAHRDGWTDVQYTAMVKTVAAILRKLGQDASHVISHKEWAGRKQGKWDPGSINMDVFRDDVAQQIGGKPVRPPVIDRGALDLSAADLQELCTAIAEQFLA